MLLDDFGDIIQDDRIYNEECPACAGEGVVYDTEEPGDERACPDCDGFGVVPGSDEESE